MNGLAVRVMANLAMQQGALPKELATRHAEDDGNAVRRLTPQDDALLTAAIHDRVQGGQNLGGKSISLHDLADKIQKEKRGKNGIGLD